MRQWHRGRDHGSVTIETVIVLPLLVFLAFFGVEVWVVIQRHALLQSVLNTALVRVQLEGEVSPAIRQDILAMLQQAGFDPQKVSFGNSTPAGVVRRRGEPLHLEIGYPKGRVMTVVRLLGLEPPDPNGYMWVSGTTISERP